MLTKLLCLCKIKSIKGCIPNKNKKINFAFQRRRNKNMKKSVLVVAGVAAFAGLAMPLATFAATDPIKDDIQVTVDPSCSFERTSAGTFTDTVALNNTTTFGTNSSTYKVICNDPDGYQVTSAFVGLTAEGTTDTIAYDSSSEVAAGTGTWVAIKAGTTATKLAQGAKLLESSTVTTAAGETATVSYKASTKDNQATGVYKGSATYTFAQKPVVTP